MDLLFRRKKTLSESSDDGGSNVHGQLQQQQQGQPQQQQQQQQQQLVGYGDVAAKPPPTGPNLKTSAMEGRYFHDDVDGMVPYSYYERKPEFYDVDGKITYKYFNQYKSLDHKAGKDQQQQQQQEKHQCENFLYDVDGKVPYHTYYYPTDRARFK